MIGTLRFAFHDYVRSYRYVAPLLAFMTFLIFVYTVVPNPVMPSYSMTVSLTFLIAAWLGFGFVDAEDETQQLVGVLHAGGWITYFVGRWLLMLGVGACLTIFATFYPILFNKFDRQPGVEEVLSALAGHMGMALLGVGIAYLFTCRLVGKLNYAITGLVLVLSLSFAAGGIRESLPEGLSFIAYLLPPVFSLIDAFNRYETASMAEAAYALAARSAAVQSDFIARLFATDETKDALGRVCTPARGRLSPPFRTLLRHFCLTYLRHAFTKVPCMERKFGKICWPRSMQTRLS